MKQIKPLEKTGVCPVNCSSTLAALVSLSPDSPTQMFKQSLRMRSSLMGLVLFFLSLSWKKNVLIKKTRHFQENDKFIRV